MQPGLEKVFFTLQEELLKPQAQAVYKPREKLVDLVREPNLADVQQQAAQVLLAGVRPKPPALWEVNPFAKRQRKLEEWIAAIGSALWWQWAMSNKPVLAKDAKAFRPGLLEELVKAKMLDAKMLTDPIGGKLTLEKLAELEKGFTPERFAMALTVQRMQNLVGPLTNYSQQRQAQWFKGWQMEPTRDGLERGGQAAQSAAFPATRLGPAEKAGKAGSETRAALPVGAVAGLRPRLRRAGRQVRHGR